MLHQKFFKLFFFRCW